MKVKLFRKGRLVGLVMPDFHNPDHDARRMRHWQKLDLPVIGVR